MLCCGALHGSMTLNCWFVAHGFVHQAPLYRWVHQLMSGLIQIPQHEERDHLHFVLGKAPISYLPVAKLAFKNAESVLDLRAHLRQGFVGSPCASLISILARRLCGVETMVLPPFKLRGGQFSTRANIAAGVVPAGAESAADCFRRAGSGSRQRAGQTAGAAAFHAALLPSPDRNSQTIAGADECAASSPRHTEDIHPWRRGLSDTQARSRPAGDPTEPHDAPSPLEIADAGSLWAS